MGCLGSVGVPKEFRQSCKERGDVRETGMEIARRDRAHHGQAVEDRYGRMEERLRLKDEERRYQEE